MGGGWGFDIHSPNVICRKIKFPRGGAQFQHQMQSKSPMNPHLSRGGGGGGGGGGRGCGACD